MVRVKIPVVRKPIHANLNTNAYCNKGDFPRRDRSRLKRILSAAGRSKKKVTLPVVKI